MSENKTTREDCDVCEYIRIHEWVGPGRHHCTTCCTTWSGTTQAHCTMCHAQFSTNTAAFLHQTDEGCQPPDQVKTRSGEPALEARRLKYGDVWYRVKKRAAFLPPVAPEPVPVSILPAPDEGAGGDGPFVFSLALPSRRSLAGVR